MNPELPKPIRDALAKQTAGEVHPSADVLTSFAEQTLPHQERVLITNHLAQCLDCREVVFLASDAAEELVDQEQEQELMPVFPIQRISPALQAQGQFQSVFHPAPASAAPASPAPAGVAPKAPRRKWALRLVWAVPVAAAVLLASGALLQWRRGYMSATPQLTSRVAGNAPMLPAGQPQHVTTGPPASEAKKRMGAWHPTDSANTTEQGETIALYKSSTPKPAGAPTPVGALASGAAPPQPAERASAHSKAASAERVMQALSAVATEDSAKAAVPVAPTHNTFAESAANHGTAAGGLVAAPQISARGFGAARTQWRITADGHLEHSGLSGWERALNYQTIIFHAVAAVGDDVWAGGDDGALFHSSDRGLHWKRVRLTDAYGAETGVIVSIQFDDPQHGSVTIGSDSRWSTADGGVTWSHE